MGPEAAQLTWAQLFLTPSLTKEDWTIDQKIFYFKKKGLNFIELYLMSRQALISSESYHFSFCNKAVPGIFFDIGC